MFEHIMLGLSILANILIGWNFLLSERELTDLKIQIWKLQHPDLDINQYWKLFDR